MPQRFIENDEIKRLEEMTRARRLAMSLGHAWRWGRQSGLSLPAMMKLALKAASSDDSSFAQTVMAPNLPTLVQRGLVLGDPDSGLMPSGQAAAAIGELGSCEELIARIVREAEARLRALGAFVDASAHSTGGAA